MKYILLLFIVAVVLLPVVLPVPVHAQSAVAIPNPIKCNDVNCLVAQVIRYILGTIAIIATLMFVWGGFMMLTSGGSAERIKKAKETLAWAAIGLVVIMLSWAIIRFVLGSLINNSNTANPPAAGCCIEAGVICRPENSAAKCTAAETFDSRTCAQVKSLAPALCP